VEAAAVLEPGSPLFLRSDSAVFAGIRRADPFDVVTPYGYGGPVGVPFWDEYDRWCRDSGIVTTFVRFHPLYANQKDAAPFVHVERLAGTVAWRLDQRDLFEGMHRHHRRVVRKAGGTETTVGRGALTLDGFVPLYEQTMDRKDASGFYFFPPEYWHALAALDDRIVLFRAGDDASLLCFATPPWLHYHLGATSEAGRKSGVSNLLFLEAARWGATHGCTRFHLGGGLGGRSDSLFEFKQRFDPGGVVEMAVGKVVHDEDAYRALGGTGTAGFFPAYRGAASTVRA
jgi:serine/alanine adding enzyme